MRIIQDLPPAPNAVPPPAVEPRSDQKTNHFVLNFIPAMALGVLTLSPIIISDLTLKTDFMGSPDFQRCIPSVFAFYIGLCGKRPLFNLSNAPYLSVEGSEENMTALKDAIVKSVTEATTEDFRGGAITSVTAPIALNAFNYYTTYATLPYLEEKIAFYAPLYIGLNYLSSNFPLLQENALVRIALQLQPQIVKTSKLVTYHFLGKFAIPLGIIGIASEGARNPIKFLKAVVNFKWA